MHHGLNAKEVWSSCFWIGTTLLLESGFCTSGEIIWCWRTRKKLITPTRKGSVKTWFYHWKTKAFFPTRFETEKYINFRSRSKLRHCRDNCWNLIMKWKVTLWKWTRMQRMIRSLKRTRSFKNWDHFRWRESFTYWHLQ